MDHRVWRSSDYWLNLLADGGAQQDAERDEGGRIARVVTPFQSQHVAVAGEDNGLPRPVSFRFLGDHQVADGDVVPGCR